MPNIDLIIQILGHMRVYMLNRTYPGERCHVKSCQQIHGTQNGTQNQWAPKWLPSSSSAVQGRGDVGRRPNGIVFFFEITGFQRREIYANKSQIVNSRLFRNTTRNHVPTCWHTKTSDIKKSSTKISTLQHVDRFMLFNSHIFNSNINVKSKQSRIAGVNNTPGGCDSPLE